MAQALNFAKRKKQHWLVTLNDNDNTTLLVLPPSKSIMERAMVLEEKIKNSDSTVIDDMFEICAEILSHNKAKIEVTADELDAVYGLDFSDCQVLYFEYMKFSQEGINPQSQSSRTTPQKKQKGMNTK